MKRILIALAVLTQCALAQNNSPYYPNQGASLPSGSQGQILINSNGSNTYVAAPNIGLLNFPAYASATTPLYLESHFRDDTTQMFMAYSADAKNYVQLDATPAYNGGGSGIRDIGIRSLMKPPWTRTKAIRALIREPAKLRPSWELTASHYKGRPRLKSTHTRRQTMAY
jgi:hypothetical protein